MSVSKTTLGDILGDLDVSNIYLYVADAVRYDALPERIDGLTVKTVAASIHTATSFPSIVSGTYLPQHGIKGFSTRLTIDGLLQIPETNTAFSNTINSVFNENPDLDNPLSNVLGVEEDSPETLESIEPPFVYVERGKGGHAPYGDYDGNGWEYFRERKASAAEQYREEYEEGVEIDAEWFESRVETLRERGLAEDTLIIYTSDHGELLGEQGCLGHNAPIHPALVYVPTVFVHPAIEPGETESGILRHVDFYPTIRSLLVGDDDDISSRSGIDLTTQELPIRGASFYRRTLFEGIGPLASGDFGYESLWDTNGGYVLPTVGFRDRAFIYFGKLIKSAKREFLRHSWRESLPAYLSANRRFGEPSFQLTEAKAYLTELRSVGATDTEEIAVPTEQLRNLGYMQ